MPKVFGIPLWLFILIIVLTGAGISTGSFIRGGKPFKKISTAAFNADIIKGGYNAYKKIKG